MDVFSISCIRTHSNIIWPVDRLVANTPAPTASPSNRSPGQKDIEIGPNERTGKDVLEQPLDGPVRMNLHILRSRLLRQSRHRHDVTRVNHHKARTR